MNKSLISALFSAFFASTVIAAPVTLIVDFKDDTPKTQVRQASSDLGRPLTKNSIMFSKTKITHIQVDSADVEKVMSRLKRRSDIQNVEVSQTYYITPQAHHVHMETYGVSSQSGGAEFEVPNDPSYEKQMWHFNQIELPRAWKVATGKGIVVAVVDTGVTGPGSKYPVMPDLRDTCIIEGYDFVADTTDAYDRNSHGTHVASTIAESTNNGVGGVGIAFGACILPVKVLSDQGSGTTADIAEGIVFAVDHGADVINMSLGGGGFSQIIKDALDYAVENDVLVFCAAGNDGRSNINYPAAMDGCHAVSAVGPDRKLAPYSSHGRGQNEENGLFISAPGGNIRDFGVAGGIWQSTVSPEDHTKWGMFPYQGTSMATPMVAGAAALVLSALPELDRTSERVLEILATTANWTDDPAKFGSGQLNVGAAAELAAESGGGHRVLWLFAVGFFLMFAVFTLGKKVFG